MADVLRQDRDDRGVVTLTMDRPEALNAFSPELMDGLGDALADLAEDDTVRAVVVTGAGRAFSAGADLNWMSSVMDNTFEQNVTDSGRFEAMLRAVERFPHPILARVNGHALGGAAGIIACVDIAVAVRGAKIGFTEARVGIAPSMISVYVQDKIGVGNARRYFLTGEPFDADRAFAIGLVHEVFDPDELDAGLERVIDGLLAAAPGAQREIKRLVRAVAADGTAEGTERLRVETIARLRAADEGQQGMRAFFDKHPAPWVPDG